MPNVDSFRFDVVHHEYIGLTGEVFPHITGMLQSAGWIDDTWYTEESCARGQAVHSLTADYDLGALDAATCVSRYRGYLLGHVSAMTALRPSWTVIEEPFVHPTHRYGGRPDRAGKVLSLQTVLEVKSGQPERSHEIQTALQAILLAARHPLPAEHWQRLALYLKPNGRYKLELHKDRRDFDEARRIIKRFAA